MELKKALLLDENKTDEAMPLFVQTPQGEPLNAHFQNNLGIAYEKRGKLALAIAVYKKAVALDATLSDAQSALTRLSK